MISKAEAELLLAIQQQNAALDAILTAGWLREAELIYITEQAVGITPAGRKALEEYDGQV